MSITEEKLDIGAGISKEADMTLEKIRKLSNDVADRIESSIELITPLDSPSLGDSEITSPTQAAVVNYFDGKFEDPDIRNSPTEGDALSWSGSHGKLRETRVVTDISGDFSPEAISNQSFASSRAIYDEIQKALDFKKAPCWTCAYDRIYNPQRVFNIYSLGNFISGGHWTYLYEGSGISSAISGSAVGYCSIEIRVPRKVTRTFRCGRVGGWLTLGLTMYRNGEKFWDLKELSSLKYYRELRDGKNFQIEFPAGTYIFSIKPKYQNRMKLNWDNMGLIDYKTIYPGPDNGRNIDLMPSKLD